MLTDARLLTGHGLVFAPFGENKAVLKPVLEKNRRKLLFPLSNQIVHFHGLSSTWCTAVSLLTEISRIFDARMNS